MGKTTVTRMDERDARRAISSRTLRTERRRREDLTAGVQAHRGGQLEDPRDRNHSPSGVRWSSRKAAQEERSARTLRCVASTGRANAADGPHGARPMTRLERRKWWAGAESNCHSRRRGFYRPLGSPPAQPTHVDRARRAAPSGGAGGDEGTRTPDLRDANAALSQLSYIPTGTGRHGVGDRCESLADAVRTPVRARGRPGLGSDGCQRRDHRQAPRSDRARRARPDARAERVPGAGVRHRHGARLAGRAPGRAVRTGRRGQPMSAFTALGSGRSRWSAR